MKPNNSLMVMSVLSLFIILLGSTFSYFNISARSNPNDMSLTAMNFDTSVEVTALHNDKSLIPMDDSDVMKAYSQNCIDDDGYGACQAYNIEITNNGLTNNYDGIIKFTVNDIVNLKYLVLDEDNDVYVPQDDVVDGTDLTLGDEFSLDTNESKNFVLIIWLSNLEESQNSYDGHGVFSAVVTYKSTSGSKITGTFSVS